MSREDCIVQDDIADLQARLTYQEDEIRALNQVVATQARELTRVKQELERLAGLLSELQPSQVGSLMDEPPPPHY